MVTLLYCNTKGIIQLFGQYGIICEDTIWLFIITVVIDT